MERTTVERERDGGIYLEITTCSLLASKDLISRVILPVLGSRGVGAYFEYGTHEGTEETRVRLYACILGSRKLPSVFVIDFFNDGHLRRLSTSVFPIQKWVKRCASVCCDPAGISCSNTVES